MKGAAIFRWLTKIMTCHICRKYRTEIGDDNCMQFFDELVVDVEAGRIFRLDGSCELNEVYGHLDREDLYAITQKFRCSCGSYIKWGVCIRGKPLLEVTV